MTRTAKMLRVTALWVCLLCFALLQFRKEAPLLPQCLAACLSFSLGMLATFTLFLQAHRLAESAREIRALCEGLYLYLFLMGIFVLCLLSENLRQGTGASTGLLVMVMGAGVIGSAIWVVILGMRALRALGDTPGDK